MSEMMWMPFVTLAFVGGILGLVWCDWPIGR